MEAVQDLWEEYKRTKDHKLKATIITKYLYLVKYVVDRIQIALPMDKSSSEVDDLISCGIIGMMDAIEKFAPERGIKFQTYALPRIRGAILDELRSLDWAPRLVRQKARRLEQVYKQLEDQLLRAATDEEVCAEMGISLAEFHTLLSEVNSTTLLSLNKTWKIKDDGRAVQRMDMIEDSKEPDPESVIEKNELKQLLKDAIKKLPEREKIVIALYYYEGLTLKEIGNVLNVSESRICQMHTKAVLRLRSRLGKLREILVA